MKMKINWISRARKKTIDPIPYRAVSSLSLSSYFFYCLIVVCVRQFSAHTDTNSHQPFSALFPDDFHSFLSFALFCFKALFHDVMCNISHSPSLFLLHIEYYLHLNASQSDTFSRLLWFSFLFHFTVCRFKIHFGFDRFLGLCLMNGFFFIDFCPIVHCTIVLLNSHFNATIFGAIASLHFMR